MRRTLLLLVMLAGCSKAEEELQPFAVNTPVVACPLCRSPAYLSEIWAGENYYDCGRHRISTEKGEISSAKDYDNPRMRARIAKYGILKKDFGGVTVEKTTD